MPHATLLPTVMPPYWGDLVIEADSQHLSLSLDGRPLIQLRRVAAATPELHLHSLCAERAHQGLWAACYMALASDPQSQRIAVQVPAGFDAALSDSLSRGLLLATEEPQRLVCERGLFWQLPQPWLGAGIRPAYPAQWVMSSGKRHPRRAPKPSGEVYRRFDPHLGAWVSLRTLDLELDLERFSRWQNTPRVLAFWEEGGSLAQHRQYLQNLQDDPHALTVIACFDDEPFAYFEAYWAKEDRIAPFYDVDDYDRGIHMLVGEEHHRGPHKVASWMSALVHYLFLDDPRTQRVVAEPRVDNQRMIGYLQSVGFHCDKAFDFPHKRAALMVLGRERFFDRCTLG